MSKSAAVPVLVHLSHVTGLCPGGFGPPDGLRQVHTTETQPAQGSSGIEVADTAIMEAGGSTGVREDTPLLRSAASEKCSRQRFRRAVKKMMKDSKPEPHVMNWAKLESEFNWSDLWTNR